MLDEIMAPGHVHHLPGEDLHGLEEIKTIIRDLRIAFPDMRITTIEDEIVSQDKVVFRWTTRCTHMGDFYGMPPTGNTIEYGGIDIIRFEKGRIVELWSQMDKLSLRRQLNPT